MSEKKEEEILESTNEEEVGENEESANEEEENLEINLDNIEEISFEDKYNELNDKYHRVYADFDNTKKRLEKEKYLAIDYAIEKFAKEILAPIDSLEMALNHAKTSDGDPKELLEKLEEGIELTIKQFITAFNKSNLEVIESEGEFDPHYHNAIMQVESEDHAEGNIVSVMQKGYMLNEKVIRPSMVSICKK